MAQTLWITPTATHAQSGLTNPNNAWADDSAYATSSSSSAYGQYDGFSFSLPATAVVVGIEVKVNAKENGSSDNWLFDVRVSNNQGSSWSSIVSTTEPGTTDTDLTVGSSLSLWGITDWSASNIDTNFVVDLGWTASGLCPGTLSLDAVSVRITYAYAKTFTADGIIKEVRTRAISADGIVLVQNTPKTFTVDGIVILKKTFTVDALIKQIKTSTLTVDGIIRDQKEKNFTADGLVFFTGTMAIEFTADGEISSPPFYIENVGLPRPKELSREFILFKTDMATLSGKYCRDVSYLKEKYLLTWEDLTLTQMAGIDSIIALDRPVLFYADDGDLQITPRYVFAYIAAKEYSIIGSDYRVALTLELIQEEPL